MPAERLTQSRSIRSDEQHPYVRPPEPLGRFNIYREPARPVLGDTRKNTSPRVVNSQSLLDPTFSEKQTWAKMGSTLIKEVQSSRLTNVPKLAEDLLPDEVISKGMADAKGDNTFNITFTGIITRIRDVPLRIGKLIAANFWQGRREDTVELESEQAYVPVLTETDSTMQAMAVDDATTRSSDQDSQATLLDENASLASGSDGGSTKVSDDSDTASTVDLKKDKKGGRKGRKKAEDIPKKPLSSEEETAIFLNRIADQIREAFGIDTKDPKRRVFSARFKDKAPDDAPIDCIRKPDCAVLDYKVATAEKARWSDIHSLIEIKKSSAVPASKDAYNELLNCARMVFAAQHNRRFVLGATISCADMILFVFDRSGVVGSKTFDINKEPEFLVRVICGFMFVDNIRLGFDTTIKKKKEGGKGGYTIRMNGIDFDCEEPMYIEKAVRGRGTGCFKTSHEGDDAVIKDSWVDESRKRLEHEILDKVKDVKGVVRVINHDIVQVEGKDDSTSVARRRLAENKLWDSEDQWKGFNMIEARTHRRILMKPYGQPLESFASLKELMLAIKDIVKIIEDLIERKVLHRDISLRNLILAREDPDDPNSRIRGYLIDFDYALDLENISEDVAKGARTGTLPFMAIEMLVEETNNRIPHAYYHDLESVFYSLCWLCTSQQGPYNTPRRGFKFSESTCAKWNGIGMDNPTLEDIRDKKAGTIYSDAEFTTRVMDQFAPYFAPLKPVVAALRQVMVNKNSHGKGMDSLYLEQMKQTKEIFAFARQNGYPINPILLATIPNSERDYRDVFNTIYGIIDKYLVDIEEPPLPKYCVKPAKEDLVRVKRFTREELDYNQPKGYRELVDGNADAKFFRLEAVAEVRRREMLKNAGEDTPASNPNLPPCSDAYQKLANLSEAGRKFAEQLNNKAVSTKQSSQPLGSSSVAGSSSEIIATGFGLMNAAEIDAYGSSTRKSIDNASPPPSPGSPGHSVARNRTPTPADYSDFGEYNMTSISSSSIYGEGNKTPTRDNPHCNSVADMGIPLDHPIYQYSIGHNTSPPPRSERSTSSKRSTSTRDESELASTYGSPKRQRLQ